MLYMNKLYVGEKDFQPWPDEGNLASRQDLTLEELRKKLGIKTGPVHAYIVSTVRRSQDGSSERFLQIGCAPNFQGSRITLCTCRFDLRMFHQNKEDPNAKFKGHWYVGFTGSNFDKYVHYLFYIMKVERAFRSQAQIFAHLDPKVKSAKNATKSVFGDLYQPKSNVPDEWDPTNYERPKLGHKHYADYEDTRWYEDIKYVKKGLNNRSAPLIGDNEYSFLWSKPQICKKSDFPPNHIRGQDYASPQELLSDLLQIEG